MADQNSNTLGNLSDFSILFDRLRGSNAEKQTEKLNKNLEGLNKSILAFAKNILPQSGLGNTISEISSNRKVFNTFGQSLRENIFGRRTLKGKFGTLRNTLDTFGIISKGSEGMFDKLLERREVKNQFISDQLKVNPQMLNTKENREIFGKKFDVQQKIQKRLNEIQAEIDRLQKSGFTEKQIGRTGLFKQRDSEAAKLVASDNRLYGKIKDEMNEAIKEGIIDGIKEAAREAEQELKKQDKKFGKNAPVFAERKYGNKDDAPQEANLNKEAANERDRIQEGILEAQKAIVDNIEAIREALENDDPEPVVEKKESILGGWLKGILGTIGGFLIGKMTGIVGMLTTGISAVLSPILKFLGVGAVGKAASDVASKAATAGAAGATVAKSGTIAEKAKGLIKWVAPKAATVAGTIGSLVFSKAALAATAAGAIGYAGYSMLPEETKKVIDDKIANFLGKEESSETLISKNIADQEVRIDKAKNVQLSEIIDKKAEENATLKNRVAPTETATIINSPTTNNNSSVVNNHIKTDPRNPETSFNRYIRNRYFA
jgi:hypothetical protein